MPRLEVLFADDHVVAIHKPSGLLVHRSALASAERLCAVQGLRDQIGQRVHPVHRLDRGASGVLLFALHARAAARLGEQFRGGRVRKRYVAVVRGWPPTSGCVDHPLRPLSEDGRARLLPCEPLPSVTHFRRLGTTEMPWLATPHPTSRYSLLELFPATGRRHQIRRHLKHVSHPIIGDVTYGKGLHNRHFRDYLGSHRLLLACTALEFRHPEEERWLTVRAPVAPEFRTVVDRLGWAADLAIPEAQELSGGPSRLRSQAR